MSCQTFWSQMVRLLHSRTCAVFDEAERRHQDRWVSCWPFCFVLSFPQRNTINRCGLVRSASPFYVQSPKEFVRMCASLSETSIRSLHNPLEQNDEQPNDKLGPLCSCLGWCRWPQRTTKMSGLKNAAFV